MYTKGPWKLTFSTDEYMEWKIEAVSNTELVDGFLSGEDGELEITSSRQPIEIASRLADEPFGELDANMRLMAASPELLESCLMLYQALKKRPDDNPFLLKHVERSIRKALEPDVDIEEVYEVLQEQNVFAYKDYSLFRLENGHYLFDIEFLRDLEEQESYYSFLLDEDGCVVEELHELSDDIECHNYQRIQQEIKKAELGNLNKVSHFIRQNGSFLERSDVTIVLQSGHSAKEGMMRASFSFENESNGTVHYFRNHELGIRTFYLKTVGEDEEHIELAKKLFADFESLVQRIEQKIGEVASHKPTAHQDTKSDRK